MGPEGRHGRWDDGDRPVPAYTAVIGDDPRPYSNEITYPPEAWNDHLSPIPVGSPKARAPGSVTADDPGSQTTQVLQERIGPPAEATRSAPVSLLCQQRRHPHPAIDRRSRRQADTRVKRSVHRGNYRGWVDGIARRRRKGLAGASRNLTTALSSPRRPGFEEGMPIAVGGSLSLRTFSSIGFCPGLHCRALASGLGSVRRPTSRLHANQSALNAPHSIP